MIEKDRLYIWLRMEMMNVINRNANESIDNGDDFVSKRTINSRMWHSVSVSISQSVSQFHHLVVTTMTTTMMASNTTAICVVNGP